MTSRRSTDSQRFPTSATRRESEAHLRGDSRSTAHGSGRERRPHTRSSGALAAFPGPEETKAASVPGDDGVRFDDVHSGPPAAPGSREPHPQHSVCRGQTEAWAARSIDHGELMPEREDFEMQRCARLDQEPKRMQQRDDDGRHASSLSKNPRNLNRRNTYGVSSRHNVKNLTVLPVVPCVHPSKSEYARSLAR